LAQNGSHRLTRRRETFADMTSRDEMSQ
jgi:hypothetical protein